MKLETREFICSFFLSLSLFYCSFLTCEPFWISMFFNFVCWNINVSIIKIYSFDLFWFLLEQLNLLNFERNWTLNFVYGHAKLCWIHLIRGNLILPFYNWFWDPQCLLCWFHLLKKYLITGVVIQFRVCFVVQIQTYHNFINVVTWFFY